MRCVAVGSTAKLYLPEVSNLFSYMLIVTVNADRGVCFISRECQQ